MIRLEAQYPPGACMPAPPNGAATAAASCTTPDHRWPASASYILTRDLAAMRSQFDDITHRMVVQTCPGRIQSPGPWRRNATPQQAAGTLVCGTQDGHPALAWTTDTNMLVAAIRGDATGPTLEQLYTWWSTHS